MLKRFLLGVALALVLAVAVGAAVYFRDMHRAYERIHGESRVIPSPWGDVEYAEGGSGPAVLVVHGSGGGFDQGKVGAQEG